MENNQKQPKKSKQFRGIKNSGIVILACLAVAVCIYKFVLGAPTNFVGGNPDT